MVLIECEEREPKTNLSALRKAGKMSAVFYGRRQKSTPISVDAAEFSKVWKKAGESSVVTLKFGGEELDSLIHKVDRNPVTDKPRHADFYVFEKGQKLKVKVPVEFTGVSPAVKDLGGVLVKVLHELEIEAVPKDLPNCIDVDISPLVNFESQILAESVKLPAGAVLITDKEEVLASVYEPKEEVVVEAPPDLSSIEVEKRGKEIGEGEIVETGADSGPVTNKRDENQQKPT